MTELSLAYAAKLAIESGFAVHPEQSDCAYVRTSNGYIAHFAFSCGGLKDEGSPMMGYCLTPEDVIKHLVRAVRGYAKARGFWPPENHQIVWRITPEIGQRRSRGTRPLWNGYCRLGFVPAASGILSVTAPAHKE